MATILRRTIFIEVDKRLPLEGNYHRLCDWALVTTSLGTMVELFSPFQKQVNSVNFNNYDATDEMRRIDDIQFISLDTHMQILSGGGTAIHGGNIMRIGR